MFITRQIAVHLQKLKQQYPILAVTGPRQSGKTTLLKATFPDFIYLSMEDSDIRSFAETDPVGFLQKYSEKVIFDEAQRVPMLFSYLQTAVDSSGQMGQFILSGSQNFHLMNSITQSLAGRVALFKLLPFDFKELKQAGLLQQQWKDLIITGHYPAIYTRNIDPAIFYANYVQTYIDRDVRELSRVHDLRLFRNFLALCAARAGQLLNLSNLANECGISQPTAKSWLSILESSYITFQLQPYYQNFNKRVTKSPKLYFYDTGLVSFLLNLRSTHDLDDSGFAGSLFENLIVAEFQKQNYHQYQLKEYWYWRDAAGNEVDMLSKTGQSFDLFEIKSTQTILPALFKGLDYFSKLDKVKIHTKNLIYGGLDTQFRTEYTIKGWREV
ncbi:MAG: ATP-binding protein [Chitinophagales bacterium]|nr:ATP-binding protein [Chitinophagales bacterium]